MLYILKASQLHETLTPEGNVIEWFFHSFEDIQHELFSQSDQAYSFEPETHRTPSRTDGKRARFAPERHYTEIPTSLVSIRALSELQYSFTSTDRQITIYRELNKSDIDHIIKISYGRCSREETAIPHVRVYHSSGRYMQNEPVNSHRSWRTIDVTHFNSGAEHDDESVALDSSPESKIIDTDTNSSIANSDDFFSAGSVMSKSTFYTAPVPQGSKSQQEFMTMKGEYARLLNQFRLLPIDPAIEQDWSGRGQHVEFKKSERSIVNGLLEVQHALGRTATATVESVKCRRILLARKTIYCNRRFTKEQAITEVAHMSKLEHSHIVRVIGTYILGRELSILMYPVADLNLEEFLEMLRARADDFKEKFLRLLSQPINHEQDNSQAERSPFNKPFSTTKAQRLDAGLYYMVDSTMGFYTCLSHALLYIHRKLVKHMDIKPRNILVRKVLSSRVSSYKVYIADFGIAKSYDHITAVDTDGRTMFTPKYAAPEVVLQDIRGFPADVFSLGCVFIEIYATLNNPVLKLHAAKNYIFRHKIRKAIKKEEKDMYESLQSLLSNNHSTSPSYQANIQEIQPWLLLGGFSDLKTIPWMISEVPADRPSMEDVVDDFSSLWSATCCNAGYEQLRAATDDEINHKDEEIDHTEE